VLMAPLDHAPGRGLSTPDTRVRATHDQGVPSFEHYSWPVRRFDLRDPSRP
jgi:hypothetical protein